MQAWLWAFKLVCNNLAKRAFYKLVESVVEHNIGHCGVVQLASLPCISSLGTSRTQDHKTVQAGHPNRNVLLSFLVWVSLCRALICLGLRQCI